jgi:hypothetical protein
MGWRLADSTDPTSLTARGPDDILLSAKWISDLELRYKLFGKVELAIGADNLFDIYPDRSPCGPRPAQAGWKHKIPVFALVHRETGQSRSFVIERGDSANILPIVRANIDRETYILSDNAVHYTKKLRTEFLGHGTVNHGAGEYVRGRIHTNTIEGFFSIFKRGMRGVYARRLQAGGLVLTSAEPANVVGSVLTRRFNQAGDVVKVGRGIWGLKEWYPGRNFKALGKNVTLITNDENRPIGLQDDNDPETGPTPPDGA